MKELFKQYVINLYQDVPTEIYEGLLSIFCLGGVVLFVFFGWKRGWRKVLELLLAEYVFLIYCSTVFCRKVSEGVVGHNFSPFWSYEAIKNGREDLVAENVMNVVAFVPVGMIIGFMVNGSWTSQAAKPSAQCSRLVSSNERHGRGTVRHGWLIALAMGLCISGSIEGMQYFLKRGFSEVDDVMHNTVGCILGYMLVKGLWLMVKGFRQRRIAG